MTIQIRPTKGKVFIKPETHKPVETFLELPESVVGREMPDRGTVFAIGARRRFKDGTVEDLGYKVGDPVIFRKFSGLWVDVQWHKLIQIGQHDVLGVFEYEEKNQVR